MHRYLHQIAIRRLPVPGMRRIHTQHVQRALPIRLGLNPTTPGIRRLTLSPSPSSTSLYPARLGLGLSRRLLSTVIDGDGPGDIINDTIKNITPTATLSRQETGTEAGEATREGLYTGKVLQEAMKANKPRHDWTKEEIREVYYTPLLELAHQAGVLHRRFHTPSAVQMCTLMNIKTGGCSEDCSYCAQSSRYNTGLQATKLSPVESVLEAARIAKSNGSTRFCMGAAWRDMRGRKSGLKNIKAMIEGVRALDMEVCVTLGMIDSAQAAELKSAGLTAYNHNVDTSREHYPNVITTRTYDERLQTLSHVRDAGINVCSGGILGLGEKEEDHIGLIYTVSTLPSHPESFPVNALVPIKGTPLGDQPRIAFDKILRTIATARIVMPETIIRIAAGRKTMSESEQMLCFGAGANAIFTGEKMLTTDCNGWDEDKEMFERWGLKPMKSFERGGYRELDLEGEVREVSEETLKLKGNLGLNSSTTTKEFFDNAREEYKALKKETDVSVSA